MSKNEKETNKPGAIFLDAARLNCRSRIKEAHAKIRLYLECPIGIGDHPDIMGEILKAAEAGSHAQDILDFLDTK